MRLTRNIALIFISGLALALIVKAAIDVRREIALYDQVSRSLSERNGFLVALAGEQALGALAVFLLVAAPTVLLCVRHLRQELARRAAADSLVVAETIRHLAELEQHHHADRVAAVSEIASMAHELGTPLAVVQARAQLIAAGDTPPADSVGDVEAILQQTRRMTQMVREVLGFARQKTALQVAIDLGTLTKQTIAMLEPLAHKRDVKFKLARAAPGAIALGEPSKLLQILTNLTMNAEQSMPNGGTVTFSVGTRRATSPLVGQGDGEADYRFVEVGDDGTGISEEDLPRIFSTFFTTKKDGAGTGLGLSGTGLGLSVSYRIASEHGGWIDVQSKAGTGSCFTLYLPSFTS